MSLKFVTRKLKTQTLGDDDGDLKEVTEKDVRSGESVKSESKNKEDNDVSFYSFNYFRLCNDAKCKSRVDFLHSHYKLIIKLQDGEDINRKGSEVPKGKKPITPSNNARSRRALRLRHHGCDDSESEEEDDREREPARILRGKYSKFEYYKTYNRFTITS